MDSRTRLDHALFQLTPTRTRCDLVIFTSGGGNEKLASGLLAPFLNHLKSAKDQISKGGYSITLRPSAPETCHWFTKSTLQRFVRFVNQPEVVERFVTLEKEILQIENSIQSNESTNAHGLHQSQAADDNSSKEKAAYKSKGESNEIGNEENSKVHLTRVLETRRAVLCKEQAMAYARALVAGFEPEYMDELIAFADAFGASRLREACIKFIELCKQKNEDRRWMAELAAMQACPQVVMPFLESSGIVLAGEDCDPSLGMVINLKPSGGLESSVSDSTTSHGSLEANQENGVASMNGKTPGPGSWAGQVPPPYMFNPYHPYMFPPGMQAPPGGPFYPPHMSWPPPPGAEDPGPQFDTRRPRRSSKKNHHALNDASESSYESESEEEEEKESNSKKKKKKSSSSRKVVIRNINYIASKRSEEEDGEADSDEPDDSGEDSIRRQVEEAVGSLDRRRNKPSSSSSSSSRRQRRNSHQASSAEELEIARDEDAEETKPDEEKKNSGGGHWDAFQNLLLRDDDDRPPPPPPVDYSEGRVRAEYFEPGTASVVAKKQHFPDEEFMFPHDEPRVGGGGGFVEPVSEEPVRSVKCSKDGEWFLKDQQDPVAEGGGDSSLIFDGAYPRKRDNVVAVDDSFMVGDRFVADEPSQFPCFSPEFVENSPYENGSSNGTAAAPEMSPVGYEPDDLFMMLDRDCSGGVEEQSMTASWTPEMDYNNETEKKKKPVEAEPTKPLEAKAKTGKTNGKPSRPDLASRAKRPGLTTRTTTGHKSKSVLEEENRRKLEEIRLERQRRIAERSANRAPPLVGKLSAEKPPKPPAVLRTSTIERLSAVRNPSPKASTKQPAKPVPGTKKPGLSKPKAGPENEAKKKRTPSSDEITVTQEEVKKEEKNSAALSPVVPVVEEVARVEVPEPIPLTVVKEDSAVVVEEIRTVEIEEIESSTPPTEVENEESAHSRKKWNSEEQSSPKASKGFRKLLLFGRKDKTSAVV